MPQETDIDEFVKLLARYDREIYRYILTLLPDRTSAEDILQETAAALWRKLPDYDRGQPFLPWAFQFAYLEVLKHRQRMGRRPMFFDDALLAKVADRRADDQTLLEARRIALDECLAALSSEDRRLLEARYSAKQTVAQLAQQTAMPAKRLYNALDRLRRRLMECISRQIQTVGAK